MFQLEAQGIDVVSSVNLSYRIDAMTTAAEPSFISDSLEELVRNSPHRPDVVFIGCSAFRAMAPGFISELESRTGVAIVTSLQAFFWLMLREAGVADQIDGYGTLFRDY